MTKNDLKKRLAELELDDTLQVLVDDLIDGAPEVNATLLESLAQTLEMDADLKDKIADVFDKEGEVYADLADELDAVSDQEMGKFLDSEKEIEEKLASDLSTKLEEIKGQNNDVVTKQDNSEISKIRDSLKQAATDTSQPTTTNQPPTPPPFPSTSSQG